MRTVTFSDAALAAELNARFACVWVNKRPSEKFVHFRQITDRDIKTLAPGAGVSNVTSMFATPEGRVLNAFPGYLDAGTFRAEMALAEEVHRWGFEDYAGLHRARGEVYVPKPPPGKVIRGWDAIGTRAHRKLAEAGFLQIEEITDPFFAELSPRMTECMGPARQTRR